MSLFGRNAFHSTIGFFVLVLMALSGCPAGQEPEAGPPPISIVNPTPTTGGSETTGETVSGNRATPSPVDPSEDTAIPGEEEHPTNTHTVDENPDGQPQGGSHGTPPIAGPTSIPGPVSLRFPQKLTIDISAISQPQATAQTSSRFVRALTDQCIGPACSVMPIGANIVNYMQRDIDRVFSPNGILGGISIPRDPSVTTYDGTVCPTCGIYARWELHIDFSPYSSPEEDTALCSGHTDELPICFRIWIRQDSANPWRPMIAGHMNCYTDQGEGCGHYWFQPWALFSPTTPGEPRFNTSFWWDHENTANLQSKMHFWGIADLNSNDSGKLFLTETNETGNCPHKLVRTRNFTERDSVEGDTDMKYVGSWKGCAPYWMGQSDIQAANPAYSLREPIMCANRVTGYWVNEALCLNEGIDIYQEIFPDLPASIGFESLYEGLFSIFP